MGVYHETIFLTKTITEFCKIQTSATHSIYTPNCRHITTPWQQWNKQTNNQQSTRSKQLQYINYQTEQISSSSQPCPDSRPPAYCPSPGLHLSVQSVLRSAKSHIPRYTTYHKMSENMAYLRHIICYINLTTTCNSRCYLMSYDFHKFYNHT